MRTAVAAALLCCTLLSACGFQLRAYGDKASAISELALHCPHTENWALCLHLKQTLVLNNIQLNDEAPLSLVVSPMSQNSRVLSLQENASAAELGLSSEVTYQLLTVHDEQIKHQQAVHVNNSYRHQSAALLAKDRERDELQKQLSQQLAEEIVRQISVLDITNWFERSSNDHTSPASRGN